MTIVFGFGAAVLCLALFVGCMAMAAGICEACTDPDRRTFPVLVLVTIVVAALCIGIIACLKQMSSSASSAISVVNPS